ncbi:MAG: hypothetical protein OEV00_14120, partial [Acidobacteriota bacterium]|nr:hypothetical protein [Acidobacteriota bacterium]
MTATIDRDSREALDEFRRYLSDEIAPLMVLDAMEHLLTSPPQLVANMIRNWIDGQIHAPGQPIVAADYLHHAVKKIYLMAEFELIDVDKLKAYLEELGRLVIAICPEPDRRSLIDNLNRIGEGDDGIVGQVKVLHGRSTAASGAAGVAAATAPAQAVGLPQQMSPGAGSQPNVAVTTPASVSPTPNIAAAPSMPMAPAVESDELSPDVVRGLRRFSALVDRLETVGTETPAATGGTQSSREQVLTQALASAAFSAQSEEELTGHMDRLVKLGLDASVDKVFRQLGSILPGWSVPVPTGDAGGETITPGARPVEAMHRLVTMAPSARESGKRFNELVASAVEQFNDGHLAQSRTMFELSGRLIKEGSVDNEIAAAVQREAHANLSQNYLRRFSESTDRRPLLKTILDFFPALSPISLLDQLFEEPKRDRRKLLLAL